MENLTWACLGRLASWLESLEVYLGSLGACLGASGASWGVFGASWGVSGASWGVPGAPRGSILGPLCSQGVYFGSPWLPLRLIFAPFWWPWAPIWLPLGRGPEMSPKFLDFGLHFGCILTPKFIKIRLSFSMEISLVFYLTFDNILSWFPFCFLACFSSKFAA